MNFRFCLKYGLFLSVLFMFSSCADFLDKRPDDDMTLEEVFAERNYAERFLSSCYFNLTEEDLFCDDNPQILTQLQKYGAEFFKNLGVQCPEFAVYHTGDALIQAETKADIAFLDVEMPGISGIHAGAKLKHHNPQIKIFIIK